MGKLKEIDKAKIMLAIYNQPPNEGGDLNLILSTQHLIGTVFSWNKTIHRHKGKSLAISRDESDEASISLVKFALQELFKKVDEYIELTVSKLRSKNPGLLEQTTIVIEAINESILVISALEESEAFGEELLQLQSIKEHLEELYEDIDRVINRLPQNKNFMILQDSIKSSN